MAWPDCGKAWLVSCLLVGVSARPTLRSQQPLRELSAEQERRVNTFGSSSLFMDEPLTTEEFRESTVKSGLRSSLEQSLQTVTALKSIMVYFIGDSTIRNQYQAFCSLIKHQTEVYDPGTAGRCHSKRASAVYRYITHFDPGMVARLMAEGYTKPDVVYFGSGLHLLHLEPKQHWKEYAHWKHYEADLRATLAAYGKVTSKLAIMDTHAICESKYFGTYARLVDLFHNNPRKAAAPCRDMMVSKRRLSAHEAQRDCEEGFFTQEGVQALNQRLEGALRTARTGATVRKVDAFSLVNGRCDATSDGRHYNSLILNELGLLFRALGWSK